MKKKVITTSAAILSMVAGLAQAGTVFAEDTATSDSRPQTELTAGKESDKNAKVSSSDQALTDKGKDEKQSDKETTVLQTEEKKPEPEKPKEEPAKEPEKLPEAGFETVGLGLLGASAAGLGVTSLAKRKSRKD